MAATSAASEPLTSTQKRLVRVHYNCEANEKKIKLYNIDTTLKEIYLEHNINQQCSLAKVEMMDSDAKWYDVDENIWDSELLSLLVDNSAVSLRYTCGLHELHTPTHSTNARAPNAFDVLMGARTASHDKLPLKR